MAPPTSGRGIAATQRLIDNARGTFANQRLRRLANAWTWWVVGDWALLVLLSVTAYDHGGTGAVAVLGAVRMLPSALAGPALAGIADRMSRVRVMVAVLASWAVLVAAIPAASVADSLLPTYLLVGAAAVIGTVLRPAMNALLPQLIDDPRELSMANSTYSLTEAAGTLIGPLVAGALVAATGTTARYLVVAAIFAVSAGLSATVRTSAKPPQRRRQPFGWRRLAAPFTGFALLVGQRRLRSVFVVSTAQTVTRGALNVLVVGFAATLAGNGLSSAGLFFAAVGAGGVVGSVLTMIGSGGRPAVSFVLGMSMWGLPLVAIAAYPHPVVAWPALVIVGIGNAIGDVSGLTLIQRIIPDHLLGRVFGAFWATAAAGQAAGSAVAALLVAWLGLTQSFLTVGVAMAAIALLSWPSIRPIDRDLSVDETDLEVLRRSELLAPLTRVTLEQLSRRSTALTVEPGTTVIKQGDDGTDFYVIDHGAVDVSVDGVLVNHLGPSECFGEIAAIRNRPRTATVITTEASRLLRLDEADFVSAVTGHRDAEQAALLLADERESRG